MDWGRYKSQKKANHGEAAKKGGKPARRKRGKSGETAIVYHAYEDMPDERLEQKALRQQARQRREATAGRPKMDRHQSR